MPRRRRRPRRAGKPRRSGRPPPNDRPMSLTDVHSSRVYLPSLSRRWGSYLVTRYWSIASRSRFCPKAWRQVRFLCFSALRGRSCEAPCTDFLSVIVCFTKTISDVPFGLPLPPFSSPTVAPARRYRLLRSDRWPNPRISSVMGPAYPDVGRPRRRPAGLAVVARAVDEIAAGNPSDEVMSSDG